MRFRIIALLAGIQAWAGLVYLFFLPADPKNQALFGFSIYRLGIIFILLGLGMFCLFLFFWNKGARNLRTSHFLAQSLQLSQKIENMLEIGALCGLVLTIAPILKPTPEIFSIHQRLLPLLIWLALVCLEGSILLAFENSRNEKINLRTHYFHRWLGEEAETKNDENRGARHTIWVVLLLLVAILVPSNNTALFSGLPISSWANGIALLLVVLFTFDRSLRDEWSSRLNHLYKPIVSVLPVVLCLVVILKLGIFMANSDSGFKACYRSTDVPPPNGKCELSFENPSFRNQATRLDKIIFFNLDDWNLSFFNTAPFDYYSDPGNIDRKRLPFTVEWSGLSTFNPGEKLVIDYSGKGTVTIGSQVTILEPSYQEVKTVNLDVPTGIQQVRISYTFNDGSRVGNTPAGPYAILRMNVFQENINKGPLAALPPPPAITLALFLVDAALLLVMFSILIVISQRLLPAWRGILFFSLFGFLVWWGLPELTFLAITALVFTWLLLWRGNHKVLLAYITLSILLCFRMMVYLPNPTFSLLRLDSTDMLVYESFARDILVSGSLRAGEPVFYFQALFRYIVFLYHLVFGESDLLRSLAVLLALNMGIFINAEWMFKNRWQQNVRRNGLVWVEYIAIAALSASSVVFLIQQGISEVFSWIFLLYAFYFFLKGTDGLFLAAAGLLALAIANRYNHLIALGFVFLIFSVPLLATKRRLLLLSLALIGLILALLPLHNWVYGQQLVFLPTSGSIAVNLVLPPAKLIMFFSDAGVQQLVFKQIANIFGFVSWKMLDICIPVFLLVTSWFVMGLDLLKRKRWKTVSLPARWLWVFPGLFLGTQFFYYMLANYPRHMYAAYLAMALVGMYTVWYSNNTGRAPSNTD
jgi:hypothetical protein